MVASCGGARPGGGSLAEGATTVHTSVHHSGGRTTPLRVTTPVGIPEARPEGHAAPCLRLQPSRLGGVDLRGRGASRALILNLVACAKGTASLAVADHGMAQPAACYRDSTGAHRRVEGPSVGTDSRRQALPQGVGSPYMFADLVMTSRPSSASRGGAYGGTGAGGESGA